MCETYVAFGLKIVIFSVTTSLIFHSSEDYGALLWCFWIIIAVNYIVLLFFQASTFYSRPRRSTSAQDPGRTQYLLPPTQDSDMEVEEDALDDMLLDEDDDNLDPDFLLNLPEDLTPTTLGKQ